MNSFNEPDLIHGAAKFDPSILTVVYNQYSPGIFRYAMRLLGDECLAEDCVSETFSRFLKALRAGQGPRDHLKAYLYRVAHNWITDCYRRQPPPPLDLDESMRASDHLQPEEQADQRFAQENVRLALRSLTPDQRLVVSLRFIEDWKNEEVAAALNKSEGTIRALQFRAIKTLRRMLIRAEKEGLYEPEK